MSSGDNNDAGGGERYKIVLGPVRILGATLEQSRRLWTVWMRCSFNTPNMRTIMVWSLSLETLWKSLWFMAKVHS